MNCKNVIVFEKKTSLLDFYEHSGKARSECAKRFYGEERTVTLALTIARNDQGNKIAKINCPINPLPVKGWFEIPSTEAIFSFLAKEGWNHVSRDKAVSTAYNIAYQAESRF